YQQMKDECMIQFESGEITTAQNALTQILRLHQVVCGSINGVDIKNDRIKNLIEVLEETDGKVIIWANYRENIHSIMEAIIEAFGNKSAVSYYGDTTADERKDRKSTRLNSSHVKISYAVFCLKKKETELYIR